MATHGDPSTGVKLRVSTVIPSVRPENVRSTNKIDIGFIYLVNPSNGRAEWLSVAKTKEILGKDVAIFICI